MIARILPLALLALTVLAGPAAATGGFSCRADDATVRFRIGAAMTRGMGGGFLNLTGRLEIRSQEIARDLRSTPLRASHIAQRWLDAQDFRLQLYWERSDPHGFVDFVLRTRAVEEGDYRGEYALTVFDVAGSTDSTGRRLERRGTVTCSVE
jgi:hypothetical protein